MDLQTLPSLSAKESASLDDNVQSNKAYYIKNPFLAAADPLFFFASRLQLQVLDITPDELHRLLMRTMQDLEHDLQKQNFRAEQILLVRYFLAAMMDDIIINVTLKNDSRLWRMYSLLTHFYQEPPGDERFFIMIDRLLLEPEMNLLVLELAYFVLLYGYQGKYRFMDNGRVLLLEKADELYQLLHWQRGDFRKSLFIAHHNHG